MIGDQSIPSVSTVSWATELLGLIPFIIVVSIVAWQFKPTRKFVRLALSIVPALLLYLMGVVALILWKPVSRLADYAADKLPVDNWAVGKLDDFAEQSSNSLLRGERDEVAKSIWPEVDYPDLYQNVPDDIQRPLYEDGRLLGGVGVVWLADRFMTDMAFRSAVRGGFTAALVVFVAFAIFLLFKVFFGIVTFLPALFEGERPIVEQWPGAEPEKLSLWSLFSANFSAASTDLVSSLITFLSQALAAVPIAAGAGIIVTFLLLTVWMRRKSEPYRLVTKDADVRWSYRSETRTLLRDTYRKQIDQATGYLKDTPVYPIGSATGILRTRGDLSAPTPGQTLKLDGESLFQHALVFGGTGEGKTTAILKPLLRQVMENRKFGAFIADAKGVFWQDAEAVAQAVKRDDDVIVIGTGEGQQGVNPIANLTPTQVAATLRSVLRQISGDASDSFWPDMAANVIRHALTVGRAYASTEQGRAVLKDEGVNPYSLWWVYRAIILPDVEGHPGPLTRAIQYMREQYERDAKAGEEASKSGDTDKAQQINVMMTSIYTPEFYASLEYLENAWVTMAVETKTGIIASVTQLLDGFSGSPILRDRFASGRNEGMADLRDALDGKIMLNALSSIEDGLPARLTSILIKTALYREARVREAEWKRDGQGRSPQDKPCLVMMDEVQELATVDPASGLSDASFWNVARSTGLAGVFATQTIAALVQAMGKEATDNFVQQARSKIFLRSEERETIEYACWCAGEYERNRVYEDGHRESLEYRHMIDGWDPFAPIDEEEQISAGPRAFFDAAAGLINPRHISVEQASSKATYDVDTRFIATDPTPGPGGGSAGNAASMGSLQAANWRAEDLTRQYRMEGNELCPALTPADMIHMGRWHAFAQIQRAGAVRQDIIQVQHDYS